MAFQGWGGIAQVPRVLGNLNLGLEVRYSADNPGDAKVATFKASYRIVKEGEDMGSGGQLENDVYELPIPAGADEKTLQIFRQPSIRNANLQDADQIHLLHFYRDTAAVNGEFTGDVYIVGFLLFWTDEENPAW